MTCLGTIQNNSEQLLCNIGMWFFVLTSCHKLPIHTLLSVSLLKGNMQYCQKFDWPRYVKVQMAPCHKTSMLPCMHTWILLMTVCHLSICLPPHFPTFFPVTLLHHYPHCSSVGHGEGTNGASPRHLSRQNSEGSQVMPANEPREHTIDCGDVVWGLAFGSSVPEKQSRCVNIEWHRFKFGQDQLLLATGLNNGRIKIWDVYTGENLGHFVANL